jgi:DNA-binding NtrC family response regulator
VGGDRWIRVDVRLLCATRRDLDQEVQAGRFRDDLFHRIAVARIELPPLRLRRGDVTILARAFAQHLRGGAASLPSELLARWERHPWPGNVRQLRNAVARQLALGDLAGQAMAAAAEGHRGDDDAVEQILAMNLPLIPARQKLIERFERRYIERILEQHGGNVVHAAAAAGIARRYFQILRAKRES